MPGPGGGGEEEESGGGAFSGGVGVSGNWKDERESLAQQRMSLFGRSFKLKVYEARNAARECG